MDAVAKRLTALKRTFVPPPLLKQSRPRNVRFTAAGRALVALAAAIFACAIGLGIVIYRSEDRPVPFPVALAIAAIGGLCLWEPHRQHRLLSEGRVGPAVVTGHKTQKTQHGTHRTMTYDFPLMSGAVRSGSSGTSAKPPAIGSVICIVYDPEEPKRSKVYPFALVTPDP